jgi:hypothetical protein
VAYIYTHPLRLKNSNSSQIVGGALSKRYRKKLNIWLEKLNLKAASFDTDQEACLSRSLNVLDNAAAGRGAVVPGV